jgi:hypothetical protein
MTVKGGQATFLAASVDALVLGAWTIDRALLWSLLASLLSRRVVAD